MKVLNIAPKIYSRPVVCKGLWDSKEPSLQARFQYGLEALDNNSILVVTSDKDKTNFTLQQYSDSIPNPVTKIYTIFSKEIGGTNQFAIYKDNKGFNLLNISTFWYIGGNNGKNSLRVEPNQSILLTEGATVERNSNDKYPLIFMTPKSYSTNNAEKYLEVQSQFSDADKIKNFNKASIPKLVAPPKKTNSIMKEYTFADIGGLDNVIEDLRKYVLRPVQYPRVFENIRLNKGILLYGPPRCGKTLLAKALANEAGVNYKYMNANEFKHAHVGESERLIRESIDSLMKEPTILVIDEIDAMAKKREGSSQSRYDDSMVNQLLGSMSDLEKSTATSFIFGLTNRKDLIDEALLATGRFGLHIEVPMPDEAALEQIYNIHSKNKIISDDVSVGELVKEMKEWEFNGSDVAEMITNSYFNALERLGMNQKMDAKLFRFDDLKKISISREDLLSSIKKIAEQKVAR